MDSNYPKELVGIWTYKWGPTLRALQIGAGRFPDWGRPSTQVQPL